MLLKRLKTRQKQYIFIASVKTPLQFHLYALARVITNYIKNYYIINTLKAHLQHPFYNILNTPFITYIPPLL